MIVVTLLAIGVTSLFGLVCWGSRKRSERTLADCRGIALQTVIIMVVLLVIAGAVAGVLITRGNEAVTDLDRQNIRAEASSYTNQLLCERASFTWSNSACS